MGRPVKHRQVSILPSVTYFKPVGIPVRCLEEICLSMEEAEAVRLKDIEGIKQEESAEKMKVSRPTFQRVLTSARRKMAHALLKGKAIRIEGGHFDMSPGLFRCKNGHLWEVPFDSLVDAHPVACPTCEISDIEQLSPLGSECPFKKELACCQRCSRATNNRRLSVGVVQKVE